MGSDKLKTYLLTFGLSGWFAGIVTIVITSFLGVWFNNLAIS